MSTNGAPIVKAEEVEKYFGRHRQPNVECAQPSVCQLIVYEPVGVTARYA